MDPNRKAPRGGGVALVALLLVALATLVVGPSGAAASSSVDPHTVRPKRALDALRTVTVSVLHQAPLDRAPSDPTTASAATALGAILFAAFVWRRSGAVAALRAERVWWRGRCWREPPAIVAA